MSEQTRLPVGLGDVGQFVMELASLIGASLIGWKLAGNPVLGVLLAIIFVFAIGTVWGRFRTPGFVPTGREPSNPVSGKKRILIELVVYAIGIFGIWWSGRDQTALIVLAVMVVTLGLSWRRYAALWHAPATT